MKRRIFIQTLMIGSGSVLIGNHQSFSSSMDANSLKVLMVYNNIGNDSNLANEWGLSIYIENKDEALLFDTGGEPDILWQNIQKSGFDLNKISKVVISHNHWDHIDGLSAISKHTSINPEVYVPYNELNNIKYQFPKANLIGINEPVKLYDFVWTTGQLTGKYRTTPIHEQSIIVIHDDSLYLFTGCSHPGIVKIVEKAKTIFPNSPIKLVAGGFHMINDSDQQVKEVSEKLRNLEVEKIAPSHCTGDKALQIFKEEWVNNFIDFNLSQNQLTI